MDTQGRCDHAGGVSCGPALGLGNEAHPSLVFDPIRKAQLNPYLRQVWSKGTNFGSRAEKQAAKAICRTGLSVLLGKLG